MRRILPILLFILATVNFYGQDTNSTIPLPEMPSKEIAIDAVPLMVAMFVEAPAELPFSGYFYLPVAHTTYIKIGGHYDVERIFRTTQDRIFVTDTTFIVHDYQRVKTDFYGSIGMEHRLPQERHEIFVGFDLYGGSGADRTITKVHTYEDTSWVDGSGVVARETKSIEDYTNFYSDKQYHIFGLAPYVGIRKDLNSTFAISGIFKPQFMWRFGHERLYSTKSKAAFDFSEIDLEKGPAFAEIVIHVKL